MDLRRAALAASAALLVASVGARAVHAAPPSLAALDPKVISYYPATGGWTTMWASWNPAQYRADFARIAALGATSVRIIVPAVEFGYPDPADPYVSRLQQLVGLAAGSGLTVQLTLFDWLPEADYADVAGSEQWARELLTPYVGDPRIAFVEVRNEIDPSDPAAMAWARQLIPYIQSLLLHEVPVTISVGGTDPLGGIRSLKAALAGAEPDFYTIHYYGGGGEDAYSTLLAAQRAVSPVPLWLGETGYPTSLQVYGFADLPATAPAQEAAQAHFLATVGYAAQELGMPPPGVWTLYDFEPGTIPVDAAHQSEPEYDFGLLRTDGSAKPAAAVVRSLFAGTAPLSFDEGFEEGVATAGGGTFPGEWSGVGSANAELAQASDDPHGGAADAVVRSLDGAPATGTYFIAPIACTPPSGAALAEASVWIRGASTGATVRLALQWLDGSDDAIATRQTHGAAPGTEWRQLRVSGAPPPGAQSVRIMVSVSDSPGSVWLDDVGFGWGSAQPASAAESVKHVAQRSSSRPPRHLVGSPRANGQRSWPPPGARTSILPS